MGKVKIQRNMRRNNPKPFGSNIFYVKSHSIKNLNSKEENSNLSTKPSINDSSHSTRLNRLFLSSSKKDNSLRNLRTLEDLESLWDLAESIYSTKLSMSELLDKLYITRHDVNEKITALKNKYGEVFDVLVQSRNKDAQLYIVAQIRSRNDKLRSN
jgi:hypothetical protein